MKKVAIITTGHPPLDERIFHKIGKSLALHNYQVSIFCTTQNIDNKIEEIHVKGTEILHQNWAFIPKLKFFSEQLLECKPDIVIGCEPTAILIAWLIKFTRLLKFKLIYDITEWYPENISLYQKGLKKIFRIVAGHILNFLVTNLSNYLIIGEETKVSRYRKYSPFKKYSIISYYPILEFYKPSTKTIDNNKIIFGYAGVISVSRGLEIFFNVLKSLKEKFNNYEFQFILAGRFESINEKTYLDKFSYSGIELSYYEWSDYQKFSSVLEDCHICLDIRPPNGIYERSLPIKIFDYMALGKCIVASNYKPIRKIYEVTKFGILVNPMDELEIVNKIAQLILNPQDIYNYGQNGRKATEMFFNWKICENELLRILKNLE